MRRTSHVLTKKIVLVWSSELFVYWKSGEPEYDASKFGYLKMDDCEFRDTTGSTKSKQPLCELATTTTSPPPETTGKLTDFECMRTTCRLRISNPSWYSSCIQTISCLALTTEITTDAPMTSQQTTMDSSTLLLTTDSHLTSQKANLDVTTDITYAQTTTNRQQSSTQSPSVSSPSALSTGQESIDGLTTLTVTTARDGIETTQEVLPRMEECNCAATPNSANIADLQHNRCKCTSLQQIH